MINFYPGPSKLHHQVAKYFQEGVDSGMLSMNHRSEAFMDLMIETTGQLKEKLEIPDDYRIIFTSSATECWEIIAQSVVVRRSAHFYNGAFGEKWKNYTEKLGAEALAFPFDINSSLADSIETDAELICITQNETSNGTQVGTGSLQKIREDNIDKLIAVDATSSMAGIRLDFTSADIWFASVQKCFGLPSGMGLMILSPEAIKKTYEINERSHYNSLAFILDNADKNQTPYTPNIAAIYLLNKVLSDSEPIQEVHHQTLLKYKKLSSYVDQSENLAFLVSNEDVRSYTVLTLVYSHDLDQLKRQSRERNLILGNGYGDLKSTTFRIANFPAHDMADFDALTNFFDEFDEWIVK